MKTIAIVATIVVSVLATSCSKQSPITPVDNIKTVSEEDSQNRSGAGHSIYRCTPKGEKTENGTECKPGNFGCGNNVQRCRTKEYWHPDNNNNYGLTQAEIDIWFSASWDEQWVVDHYDFFMALYNAGAQVHPDEIIAWFQN